MAHLVDGPPKRLPVRGERLVQPERPALRRGVWNEWEMAQLPTYVQCAPTYLGPERKTKWAEQTGTS